MKVWQNAGPNKCFSVLHQHCQDLVIGWQTCGLREDEEGMGTAEHLGPGMAKATKSPLLTVGNTNAFDLKASYH